MHAAVVGDDDIFELLLKHNADVMKKAWNGWTAFHVAAIFNNKNILNRLLMAVEHCNSSSLIRTASFVLTADGEDICGQTPLWLAAFHGHVDCVGVLLIHGANPDHKDKKGKSPLHIAKENGHTAVVNKLSQSIKCESYSSFLIKLFHTIIKLSHCVFMWLFVPVGL
jgi:ankyrin repeat protein